MARLESYTGSIELVDGITPKNGNDYPLVEAHDVLVGENDERLDEAILDAKLSVEGNSLVISTNRGASSWYQQVVNDEMYIKALFSINIKTDILGFYNEPIKEYHSGGTLYVGGYIDYNGVEFVEYEGLEGEGELL